MRRDILWQATRRSQDKANGVKHTPLHTLQECCAAANIDPRVFGRYAAKYPGAPQPIFTNSKTAWRAGVKYYRKHEFVQWVNQVRQQQSQSKQKEKIMPDLKSELTKVINAWEHTAPEPEPMPETRPSKPVSVFKTTNNVCRATFDCIKNNPGKTRIELATMLEKDGYKKNSTTSLMGQMVKQSMVRDTGGLLFTAVPEYRPIKSYKTFKNQQTKQEVNPAPAPAPMPERKKVTIINTRTGEVLNPKPVAKEWEPKDVIDTLTVRQAIALFKELRNILVG